MKKLYFIAAASIFEVNKSNKAWNLTEKQVPYPFYCLAANPTVTNRLYGGTFDNGLWISDDAGDTWHPAGDGITHKRVLSVAVSPTEVKNGYHVVWAGTEPSGLFRSEDGGNTWVDYPTLIELPSEPTWSFPPRPHTHHVRWIQADIHDENCIFVGIELGGVMKSTDQGGSWEDRKPGSQYDCHSLAMHPKQKGRVYEAAGGGFAETQDNGETWKTMNDGLGDYTYLVNIAIDAENPDTMIASAAKSARTAYVPDQAHTIIVRRTNEEPWEKVQAGLPEPDHSSIFSLISSEGAFFAVNNTGVYQSVDTGKTWRKIPVEWPDYLQKERIRGLILV